MAFAFGSFKRPAPNIIKGARPEWVEGGRWASTDDLSKISKPSWNLDNLPNLNKCQLIFKHKNGLFAVLCSGFSLI